MPKVGDRVGAIESANNTEVRLYGYGTYDGDFVPDGGDFIGNCFKESASPNPRITLDNGKVVWGYQCWWESEEETKRIIGQRTVINVDHPVVAATAEVN